MDLREKFANVCEASYHNASLLRVDMPLFDKAQEEAVEKFDVDTIKALIDKEIESWDYWARFVFCDILDWDIREKFGDKYEITTLGRGGATVVISELEDYFPSGFDTAPFELPEDVEKVIEVQEYLNKLVKESVNNGYDYFMTGELELAVDREWGIMLAG